MQQDKLKVIRDYYSIGDRIFTSGQPTPDQIKNISEAGFEVVINLSPSSGLDAIPNEEQLVKEAGMGYIHIPVDWQNPTRENLEKFLVLYSRHDYHLIFVHCARNMRVSAFIFLYRVIVKGETPQNCIKDLLAIWKPDQTWQEFIDRMLVEVKKPHDSKDWGVEWTGYTSFKP